jgi:hypothetical protein
MYAILDNRCRQRDLVWEHNLVVPIEYDHYRLIRNTCNQSSCAGRPNHMEGRGGQEEGAPPRHPPLLWRGKEGARGKAAWIGGPSRRHMDPPLHSVRATPDKWETSPERGCRPSAKAPTVCRTRRRGVAEERAEEDPDPCLLQTGAEERWRGWRGCRCACEGRGRKAAADEGTSIGFLLLGCEIFSTPDPFFCSLRQANCNLTHGLVDETNGGQRPIHARNGAIVEGKKENR